MLAAESVTNCRTTIRSLRFPNLGKSNLLLRGDGPFKVLTKVNDNAYILDMRQTYEGIHTF